MDHRARCRARRTAGTVAGLEAKRAELCTRLGFDPAQLATMPGDGDAKAWRQLKPLAAALRESRQQLTAATAEVEGKRGSADAASQELAKSLKARGAEKLTPLLERSGQLVSQLRRACNSATCSRTSRTAKGNSRRAQR